MAEIEINAKFLPETSREIPYYFGDRHIDEWISGFVEIGCGLHGSHSG
jgi:hypothetical protein